MSNLSTLTFKHSYKHNRGDRPIQDFLIPALSCSVLYQRAAGYFSSYILGELAAGIAGLLENGGKIELVTSHEFTTVDADAVSDLQNNPKFHEELVQTFEATYSSLATEIERHNVKAMLWMLEKGFLSIKVVVPRRRLAGAPSTDFAMYHPKFGILTDASGERVAFAGSLNETVNGWFHNIENMNVFTERDVSQKKYLDDYAEDFQAYWSYDAGRDWVVVDLPEAVSQELISRTGTDAPRADTGTKLKLQEVASVKILRPYQRDAVDAWIDAGKVGLLRMATGTGKTFTAKECIAICQKETDALLTVLIAPYQHIADQWTKELEVLSPIDLSSQKNWRGTLEELQGDVVLGRRSHITIVAVKNTAGTPDFESRISKLADSLSNFLAIGDEVHWLGAPSFRRGLNHKADWRLGLSATPTRYYDPEGSGFIEDYFTPEGHEKATVYDFPLSRALTYIDPETGKTILTPYTYNPIFLELTEDEQEEYSTWTATIAKYLNRELSLKEEEELSRARNLRAMILKQAENKVPEFRNLIESMGTSCLDMSLVYCSESDQMAKIGRVLHDLEVDYQRITSAESAKPSQRRGGKSEREQILEAFSAGRYRTLLSIDCLDEGVDVPAARTGFILASSGNPKEFIQRRGRLMRQFPGKEKADIFDFVAVPHNGLENELIFKTEIERLLEFAEDALNKEEVFAILKARFNVSLGEGHSD